MKIYSAKISFMVLVTATVAFSVGLVGQEPEVLCRENGSLVLVHYIGFNFQFMAQKVRLVDKDADLEGILSEDWLPCSTPFYKDGDKEKKEPAYFFLLHNKIETPAKKRKASKL